MTNNTARRSRPTLGSVLLAGVGALVALPIDAMSQVAHGRQPASVQGSFRGGGRRASMFYTPGPSRSTLMPRSMDPLPGGGRVYNTSRLYRPTATPFAARRADFGERRPVGSGVPAVRGDRPMAVAAGRSGFAEASGFTGNFAYSGDDFRLAIHVGSDLTTRLARSAYLDGLYCPSPLPGDGVCWPYPNYSYWPNYWPYYYGSGSIYGYGYPTVNYADDQYADPALSPSYLPQMPVVPVQAPPPEPTALEKATILMQMRRYGQAVEQFRVHLKSDSSDRVALRWLGVAQLLDGKLREGCETVARAYADDAALGDAVLNLGEMDLSQLRVRELCGTVVAFARRGESAGAYVTAAMLMQVRGRADLAIKMLTEAKGAGLDPQLYALLSQSMTK